MKENYLNHIEALERKLKEYVTDDKDLRESINILGDIAADMRELFNRYDNERGLLDKLRKDYAILENKYEALKEGISRFMEAF